MALARCYRSGRNWYLTAFRLLGIVVGQVVNLRRIVNPPAAMRQRASPDVVAYLTR
jgi:hypothetical protein